MANLFLYQQDARHTNGQTIIEDTYTTIVSTTYLPTYLPTQYPPTYLPIYLPTHPLTYLVNSYARIMQEPSPSSTTDILLKDLRQSKHFIIDEDIISCIRCKQPFQLTGLNSNKRHYRLTRHLTSNKHKMSHPLWLLSNDSRYTLMENTTLIAHFPIDECDYSQVHCSNLTMPVCQAVQTLFFLVRQIATFTVILLLYYTVRYRFSVFTDLTAAYRSPVTVFVSTAVQLVTDLPCYQFIGLFSFPQNAR